MKKSKYSVYHWLLREFKIKLRFVHYKCKYTAY